MTSDEAFASVRRLLPCLTAEQLDWLALNGRRFATSGWPHEDHCTLNLPDVSGDRDRDRKRAEQELQVAEERLKLARERVSQMR